MSEIDDLRKEISELRAELYHWQMIVVNQEGKTSRALGLAEGTAEMQGILNKSFDARITTLETSNPRIPIGVAQPTTSTVTIT